MVPVPWMSRLCGHGHGQGRDGHGRQTDQRRAEETCSRSTGQLGRAAAEGERGWPKADKEGRQAEGRTRRFVVGKSSCARLHQLRQLLLRQLHPAPPQPVAELLHGQLPVPRRVQVPENVAQALNLVLVEVLHKRLRVCL